MNEKTLSYPNQRKRAPAIKQKQFCLIAAAAAVKKKTMQVHKLVQIASNLNVYSAE